METKNNLEKIRHSLAHLLAMDVLKKQPGSLLGIGPVTENGFYYDFEFANHAPRPECLPKLEKGIRELIKQNIKFEREEISAEEARKIFSNQPYKLELIDELEKSGEKISVYKSGNFTDLCAAPHVESTSEIDLKAFKLTKTAGAYWKGDEKNKMLTRVYGVAFETEKELKNYLELLEEAEKRDHRKLGKELDLFTFSDLVGPGLPLFTPKGTIIKEELQKRIEEISKSYGFQKVITPHLAKIDLYKISGHAEKFGEELFQVNSHHRQNYVLKPVQCPHQTQIYASRPRSYRDLPIRYMESEKQYRDEKPGEIAGLQRTIAITVEDGHSFCTVGQVKDEIKNMVLIIKDFYTSLGMWGNHWVSLSVRDYEHQEKYIGDEKDWDKCENILQEVSDELNLNAKKIEGEAALYGPKLDFMFKDSMGKELQIPTVQLDFATPKRFGLKYTNKEGKEETPVMVHRAILGSYERFMMLLIEHFAGAFPVWLSPVQAKIIPVSEKFNGYGEAVLKELKENGIRAEIDKSDETLGKRIRDAELQKTPYVLVVGEKEKDNGMVAVRSRKDGDKGAIKLEKFIENIKKEILGK
jgi:threonyl-tRNA synthetase